MHLEESDPVRMCIAERGGCFNLTYQISSIAFRKLNVIKSFLAWVINRCLRLNLQGFVRQRGCQEAFKALFKGKLRSAAGPVTR